MEQRSALLLKSASPKPSNTKSARSFHRNTVRRIKVLQYCEVLQRGGTQVYRCVTKAPRATSPSHFYSLITLMSSESRNQLPDTARYLLDPYTLFKLDRYIDNYLNFIYLEMTQRMKRIILRSLEFVASVYVPKLMFIISRKAYL